MKWNIFAILKVNSKKWKELDIYIKSIIFVLLPFLLALIIDAIYSQKSKNGLIFDESLVSLLAFSILCITALMQNKDLKIQREELKLNRSELENTREELRGAKEAQEKQQKELQESNQLIRKNTKQTQFFELLRMKEEKLSNIDIQGFIIDFNQNIEAKLFKYLSEEEKFLIRKVKSIIKKQELDMLLKNKYDTYSKKYHEVYSEYIEDLPEDILRLYKINVTMNLLLEDKVIKGTIEKSLERIFKNHNNVNPIKKLTGYVKPELEIKDILENLISNREKDLYKIVSGKLEANEFLKLLNKYSSFSSQIGQHSYD